MIELRVNGQSHSVSADPDTPLLYVLRDELQLNAAKFGCGLGQCGSCTVLVDGAPIYTLKGARAGLFRALTYADYPAVSARAHGGRHA